MISLTKYPIWLHNELDITLSKMTFGKFGSGVMGAAMALGAVGEAAAEGHEALVERIDPAVMEEIQTKYQACVQEALKGSDWNGNFRIEGEEAQHYHSFALPSCDRSAESQFNTALAGQEIVQANADIAAAQAEKDEITRNLMDLVQGKTTTN